MKRIHRWLAMAALLALTLAVLCALSAAESTARAEEDGLFYEEVELYQCGGLVAETPRRKRSAGLYDAYMLARLKAQAECVEVREYGLTAAEHASAYRALINAHPELFFVSNGYRYAKDSDGYVTMVYPNYTYTGDEVTWRLAAYEAELEKIAAYAAAADTPLGKALLVNDYFCVHFAYDKNDDAAALIYNAADFFVEGRGVCNAYMLAYRAAMNRLGISSATVISLSMNHTWNMIYVEDGWYHVDVTWNDNDSTLGAGHGYFLLSDAGMLAHSHKNWEAPYTASATTYDGFFWRGIDTAIAVDGDTLYYVKPTAAARQTLCAWTVGDAGSVELLEFSMATAAGGGSWTRGRNVVCVYDGRVFYATCDSVYSVKKDGTDALLMADAGDPWTYIRAGYRDGGTLYLFVAASAGGPGRVWTFDLANASAVELDVDELLLSVGESHPFAVVTAPADQPLTWTSTDEAVATVDADNVLHALAPGAVTVTATCARGAQDACAVLVYTAVPELAELWLLPGERFALGVGAQPETLREGGWTYMSDADTVAAVDENGLVTAVRAGTAVISVTSDIYPAVALSCRVHVGNMETLSLPAALESVGEEAFAGGAFARVKAGANLTSIGARAFAGCDRLRVVALGASVTQIADNAFAGCKNLIFLCPDGSYAAGYAEARGIVHRASLK